MQNKMYKTIVPKGGKSGLVKHIYSYEDASNTIYNCYRLVPRVNVTKSHLTDGELDMLFVDSILKPLLSYSDIFLDVGCGMGLVVIQLAMTVYAKQLIGIEPVQNRLKNCAAEDMNDQLNTSITNRIDFFQGRLEDVVLGLATVVYSCNVLFMEETILEFVRQILLSKYLHTVVSFIELDTIDHIFQMKKKVKVVVSWTDSKVDLYVYKRPARRLNIKQTRSKTRSRKR